ncbi:solute:sodium symporter family transporter [Pontibacillus halophilus]|nr:solute:sodium symporter family transporter [Pontibacillus halophilus]
MLSIVTFLIFTVGVFVFTWYKARNVNMQSSEGYFLGGRSLPGIVIACSLVLTNLSTEQMVGLNGQSYMSSMTVMAWEVTAPLSLIFLAFLFLPKYLKSGITTIPDFLQQRFDLSTRQLMSILFLIGYASSFLPTVLYSGALVLDQIFNVSETLQLSEFWTIFLIALAIGGIGCFYIIYGGLRAISFADTIYGIGLILGGILIPFLGLYHLGDGSLSVGTDRLLHTNTDKLNAIGGPGSNVPWPTILTGLLFNNLFYWCTNQAIVQRSLGAKSLAEGQKGVLFAGFFKVFGVLYLVIPGLIAYDLYGGNIPNGDQAYPQLVIDVLPTALSGFFAAVLFGAIMSSFNGALNSCITLFTLDLYKPIFKPNASDDQIVKAGRIFAFSFAFLSIIITPFVLFAGDGLYNYLQEMFGFINIPILGAIVIGFFTKYVPAIAPKIATITHLILYGASKVVLGDLNFLYVLAILFPLNIALQLIIAQFRSRETPYEMQDSGAVDMTPWKHRKLTTALILIMVIGLYVFFSPLGVAT